VEGAGEAEDGAEHERGRKQRGRRPLRLGGRPALKDRPGDASRGRLGRRRDLRLGGGEDTGGARAGVDLGLRRKVEQAVERLRLAKTRLRLRALRQKAGKVPPHRRRPARAIAPVTLKGLLERVEAAPFHVALLSHCRCPGLSKLNARFLASLSIPS